MNESLFPAGENSPLSSHAEGQRTDRGDNHRSETANEQTASDDRGDEILKLRSHAVTGMDTVEPQQFARTHHPSDGRGGHEQQDLGAWLCT